MESYTNLRAVSRHFTKRGANRGYLLAEAQRIADRTDVCHYVEDRSGLLRRYSVIEASR